MLTFRPKNPLPWYLELFALNFVSVYATTRRLALISVHGDPSADIGREEAGGQNVYVKELGLAMANLSWQVDMLTRKVDRNQSTMLWYKPNCRVIRLEAGPLEFVPRDELFQYLPEFVENFQRFERSKNVTYEIVHTNYWLSGWVGMELKKRRPEIRHVHTYHSLGAVKYESVVEDQLPPVAKTRLRVEKNLLLRADVTIATSPQEEEHMRSMISKDGGRISIVPCGVDFEHFSTVINKTVSRKKLGVDIHGKLVLYVGRFDRRKGVETLLRAVQKCRSRYKNLQLIIGGGFIPGNSDWLEFERIRKLSIELNLTDITTFPGRLSREILPHYYAAADVTVVPSQYEPFGLVTIESMAAGTSVIGSEVGGLKFTIRHEKTGLLCPPKNSWALARAIDTVLDDGALGALWGESGRNVVKTEFAWGHIASRLSNLYRNLMDRQSFNVNLRNAELACFRNKSFDDCHHVNRPKTRYCAL